MAGLRGSGWEEAVGEGRSTSGRASEQAGGGHIDIDPLPRYEMAHWPAMAAAWLRRQGGVRGIGGSGERRPGILPQMASSLGARCFPLGCCLRVSGPSGLLGDGNPRRSPAGFSHR